MSKQTLSVADFATILNLVNDAICERKRVFTDRIENGQFYQRILNEKDLNEDIIYQELLHLKESLQNLNIEVETPDVEVTE